MDKVRGDTLLTIRSRDLKNVDTEGASGFFTLFEAITLNPNEVMTAKLVSATFPNSWFNLSVSSQNNTIDFKETGDTSYKSIVIENGSYNINELSDKLKTLLEANSTNNLTYTFTYDIIKNQLQIQNSNPTVYNTVFDFTTPTTCRRFLGFIAQVYTINASEGIFSDRAVDITDTQNSIYVRTNLANQKIIESSTGKYSNILAHIPVPLSRNTIFVYDPMNPFEMELTQNTISNIKIFITFQNETQIVHFNNGDWEINIVISYYRKFKRHNHHRENNMTIHRQLIEMYNNYNNKMIQQEKEHNELQTILKKRKIKST